MNENGKKKTSAFLRGAGLITAAALLGKILGAVYRIPLTRVLGAHGMGMYQSVFPTYALLVTLSGGGLASAVSKLTAEGQEKETVRAGVCAALVLSVPLALFAAAFGRAIASAAGAPEAVTALWVLVPSVPLSAVCAALRGYYMGVGDTTPSAVGQVLEQIVKLAAGLTLAYTLASVSVPLAVTGCAAGVTLGEAATLLYYGCRRGNPRKRSDAKMPTSESGAGEALAIEVAAASTEVAEDFLPTVPAASDAATDAATVSPPSIFRRWHGAVGRLWRVLRISLPVTLGLLVLPLVSVADSFAVSRLLIANGASAEEATALYGLITGPVQSLLNLPAVCSVGLCNMLLPKVSGLLRQGISPRKTVRRAFLLTASVAAAGAVMLGAGAPLALRLLYGNSLGVPVKMAAKLLGFSVPTVFFSAIIGVASAVLQGGGKAHCPALWLLTAAAIKESMQLWLLPRFGIMGLVASNDVFYFLAALCDGIAVALFLRRTDAASSEKVAS